VLPSAALGHFDDDVSTRPLAEPPPVGHPLRFTVIAHGDRSQLGPISGERIDRLVARTRLERGDHVLELGCGKGDLLVRLLSRWPALFRSSYAEWRRDAFGFAVARFRVPG